MDEIVVRSILKWPNVPSVHGWLELDRRGQWRIKSQRITNPGLTDFIARNYARDATGRFYFQNGPQRVFVRLDYLPFVLRCEAGNDGARFITHTGQPVEKVDGAWMDESGMICVSFSEGVGSIHDQDLALLLPFLSNDIGLVAPEAHITSAMTAIPAGNQTDLWLKCGAARVPILALRSEQAPSMFGFIADPQPAPGEPDC